MAQEYFFIGIKVSKKHTKSHELLKRLLCAIVLTSAYMIGRTILLYGIDAEFYNNAVQNAENLIVNVVSGDSMRCSVFALGVMPYVSAQLLVALITALMSSDAKSRISPKKQKDYTLALTIVISLIMAFNRSKELVFRQLPIDLEAVKAIVMAEMIAGALIVYFMGDYNREHGIGGPTAFMLINVIDNCSKTLGAHSFNEMELLLAVCFWIAALIAAMEVITVKIPVQRVSVHNIYADKNYIAFKPNPIGVMPVVFGTMFFMIPQFIVRMALLVFPENQSLLEISKNLVLTEPLGVYVYLATVFLLGIVFSFIMLSPGDMADNLQKGGDSIVGVYAGKATKRYLRRVLLLLSVTSGLILCVCISASLLMALKGKLPADLALFPSTVMLLTGFVCTIIQEIGTYIKYDSYKFFI